VNSDPFPSQSDVDEVELPLRLSSEDINALGQVADRLRASRRTAAIPSPGNEADLLGLAQSIYRLRRLRDEVFGDLTFADPRWDMLLDLFIAREKDRKITVSSACIGAAVPATTALRHLSALVRDGLVERVAKAASVRVRAGRVVPARDIRSLGGKRNVRFGALNRISAVCSGLGAGQLCAP